jgi:uncharacterized protein YunC (DUF1805 family)
MDKINVNGKEFRADAIPVCGGVKILVIQGSKGMLGCGYLSIPTAEKLGHALAIVSGVSTYEDMLKAEIKAVSTAAQAAGITIGMSGANALEKLF